MRLVAVGAGILTWAPGVTLLAIGRKWAADDIIDGVPMLLLGTLVVITGCGLIGWGLMARCNQGTEQTKTEG